MTKRDPIDLFAIAIALIPFDNLVIAPSAGWATIAPFFFLAYVFLNIKYVGRAFSMVTARR